MKVVVAGGTGWLGTALRESLAADGHEVVVLSRSGHPPGTGRGARFTPWDGRTLGAWAAEVDGADAVVNFAGAPIAPRRWTTRRKQILRESRLVPTRALVGAIEHASSRPAVLINTSAVGYYGDRGDDLITEAEPPGRDFLARLVADWEAAARPASELGVRLVLARVGVVLGQGGGALPPLAIPFRAFLGGHVGSGQQWVPWIHRDDVASFYRFALERTDVEGPVNVVAPEPATNRELARAIGQVLGRPAWLPVPAAALWFALGELGSSLLNGQRVVPAAAQRQGYTFREPALLPALRKSLR